MIVNVNKVNIIYRCQYSRLEIESVRHVPFDSIQTKHKTIGFFKNVMYNYNKCE